MNPGCDKKGRFGDCSQYTQTPFRPSSNACQSCREYYRGKS